MSKIKLTNVCKTGPYIEIWPVKKLKIRGDIVGVNSTDQKHDGHDTYVNSLAFYVMNSEKESFGLELPFETVKELSTKLLLMIEEQ